jgi:hypothetical protein
MSRRHRSPGLPGALLLAAGALALAGPGTARPAPPVEAAVRPAAAVLASYEEWSWDSFVKFWKKQLGKTSGVIGVVMLVAAGAALIIVSRGRYG